MGDGAVAAEFSEQFVAIMDSNKVLERFRNFLFANNCTQVSDFATVCAEEKLIASEIIEACEIGDLNFGEKLAIKKTWVACRASTFPGGAVVPSTAPSRSGPNKKLPDGVEDRLRGRWHARHKFHLPGSWLAKEGLVTEIYTGLHAPKKYLYVPAMEAIVRMFNLSQKPISGTLILCRAVSRRSTMSWTPVRHTRCSSSGLGRTWRPYVCASCRFLIGSLWNP